jgi:hypothetical protein
MANKDRYRPSRGVPDPRIVPRGEGVVPTIYPQERCEFVPRDGGRRVGFGRGEFVGRSFARGQYGYGGNDHSFRSQSSYRLRSPLRGTRSPPRDVWVFHLGETGWILLIPFLSKWHVLTIYMCIKLRLDMQANKSSVVVKGPFFPYV